MVVQDMPIPREGLPYWIFWFMLCVIVLLLAFIFLRDKELRQRVNEFLSGAKKRMKRAQLKMKANREKRRKDDLVKELGQRAWTAHVPGEAYEPAYQDLDRIAKEVSGLDAELDKMNAELTDVQKQLDAARAKTKQIQKPEDKTVPPDAAALQAAKDEERRLKKDIQDRQQKISAVRSARQSLETQKADKCATLGVLIDQARPDHKEVLDLYVQIDKLNRAILAYMNEIEQLK
jgi:DNA repair exonuclease SbcCD ATPase subunit